MAGEKTEQASQKKREDERKKGNVFKSKDVTTLATLVTSFYAYSFFIRSMVNHTLLNYENQMARVAVIDILHPEEVMQVFREIFIIIAVTLIPAMALIGLVAFLVAGAQTKFLFSQDQIKFKMERIDFLKGIKRLVSVRSLVELFKSLVKIILLTWLLYGDVLEIMRFLPDMMDWDILQAADYTGEQIMALVLSVAVAFGAVAMLDYIYQRWEYEKGIRMSKQELKDEYKQMEGNPEVKGARKQLQREYAQRRMMAGVKDADVVVRNPTHYAVALKYQIETDPAPMVLAKGADKIALKIVAEAEKHGVSTIENKTLARGLYDSSDVFGYIPAEFFQSVAELLAWLYSTKEKSGKDKR